MGQKKIRQNRQQRTKLGFVARSLSKGTRKKFETYAINSIYSKLNNPELEIATQQYVHTKDGRRFIDLYFPQLKVGVEIDEGYHDDPWQKEKDAGRTAAIKLAVLESTILDEEKDIEILRIATTQNGTEVPLEEFNKSIDDVVLKIKRKIEKIGNLKWVFEREHKLEGIKSRGKLVRGDSFDYMKDILYVFGKEVKGWQKCWYKTIWSPVLSVNGSERNGWINTMSEDLTEIYESWVGEKPDKTEENLKKDIANNVTRYCFLKFKDVLGYNCRKFIGVYKADRYDMARNTEVWKLVSDTAELFEMK